MKCPTCGKRLRPIMGQHGEWVCDNNDCPNNKGSGAQCEFYGDTQAEVNANPHEPRITVGNEPRGDVKE